MARTLRIAVILTLALTIVLSCTVFAAKLTDPETYEHTIEVLDKNRVTVLGLSAASAAASAAVSALPEDVCTPLAEEISESTTWFLLILSVIYLEKYLLTIFGAVACYFLLPVGCSALLVNSFYPRTVLKTIGTKCRLSKALCRSKTKKQLKRRIPKTMLRLRIKPPCNKSTMTIFIPLNTQCTIYCLCVIISIQFLICMSLI